MPSSTSGPASTRPQLRQAQSVAWSWPRLVPIQRKHPLASAAGPPSVSPSIQDPSEKSNKSPSPQGSQILRSPSQVSLPTSPISSKASSERGSRSPSLKDYQKVRSPSQISLPSSLVPSNHPSEESQGSEGDQGMYPSVTAASTVAADEPESKTVGEKLAHPFDMADQANEEPITVSTRASEVSAEDPPSADTALFSLRRAVTAILEHLNPMEEIVPHVPTQDSEAAIPTAAPNTIKIPAPVEASPPEDEVLPIESISPVEKAWAIETPPHIEDPFAGDLHSPVEEAAQPPSAFPITSLPPPRITFQRATEDVESREAVALAAENMEPVEGFPTATTAETLNELPSTAYPPNVTNVLPEPLEGAPAPVLPPVKRRKLYLRKARNMAARKTVLKAMLGRQLAHETKQALRVLAQG